MEERERGETEARVVWRVMGQKRESDVIDRASVFIRRDESSDEWFIG